MNLTNKLLSLNNISKTYHSINCETKALDNISFDLYKNEFIGIIGPSGCGKSSILNKLIEEDKAIVTSVAGTTRDIVEGQIRVNGILLNIIDTAGVRETEDIVEKIGVEKSLSLVNDADLIILVFNNNEKLTDEDKKLLEYTKEKKRIIVINKIDLENNLDISNLKNERIVKVSALKDSGIENLKNEINDMFNLEEINLGDFTYLSNSRQISLVKKEVEISKNLAKIELKKVILKKNKII